MKTESAAQLVTIYVNSSDQWHGRPLYSAIVSLCQAKGVAGATVIRCLEGFGSGHQLHMAHLLELRENVPVRIEVVDTADRIAGLLPELEPMLSGGLISVADVEIRRYPPDAGR